MNYNEILASCIIDNENELIEELKRREKERIATK